MTKADILNAVNEILVAQWPERTVYIDVCPVDFDRPSFWLTVEKQQITDANRFLIRKDLRLLLTLYDELDAHYEASWWRLGQETDTAMLLLGVPLKVAGRTVKLNLKELPREADRALIQIDLSWMDNRPGQQTENKTPAADSYTLRYQKT